MLARPNLRDLGNYLRGAAARIVVGVSVDSTLKGSVVTALYDYPEESVLVQIDIALRDNACLTATQWEKTNSSHTAFIF